MIYGFVFSHVSFFAVFAGEKKKGENDIFKGWPSPSPLLSASSRAVLWQMLGI